jgi:hypothetical protein
MDRKGHAMGILKELDNEQPGSKRSLKDSFFLSSRLCELIRSSKDAVFSMGSFPNCP